jgi:hypothetical protein
VAGIGSSDFHLADFGFGGYCDFPRFVQILHSARLPCQLNSNPVCILFFQAGSIFNWTYILYTSFFIYTFKSITPFIHKYGLQMAWSQIHKVVSINLDFQIFETTLCWNPMYAFLANCLQLMCVSCSFFTSQTCIMCFTHATYSVIPFRR